MFRWANNNWRWRGSCVCSPMFPRDNCSVEQECRPGREWDRLVLFQLQNNWPSTTCVYTYNMLKSCLYAFGLCYLTCALYFFKRDFFFNLIKRWRDCHMYDTYVCLSAIPLSHALYINLACTQMVRLLLLQKNDIYVYHPHIFILVKSITFYHCNC